MPSKCSEVKKSYNLVEPPEFTKIDVWKNPSNTEMTGMGLNGSKGYVGLIKDIPGQINPSTSLEVTTTVSEFGLSIKAGKV